MRTKYFIPILIFLYFFSVTAKAQNAKLSCQDVKTGVFYSYPKNIGDHYIAYMSDHMEKAVEVETGDTILSKIYQKGRSLLQRN